MPLVQWQMTRGADILVCRVGAYRSNEACQGTLGVLHGPAMPTNSCRNTRFWQLLNPFHWGICTAQLFVPQSFATSRYNRTALAPRCRIAVNACRTRLFGNKGSANMPKSNTSGLRVARRFADIQTQQAETSAWSLDVNCTQRGVDCQMKVDGARCKLKSVYPKIKT